MRALLSRLLIRLPLKPDEWRPVPYAEACKYPPPVFRGFEHVLNQNGQIAVLSANPPVRRTTPDQVLRNRRIRTARRKVWYLRDREDGIVDPLPPYQLQPAPQHMLQAR